MCRTPRNPRPLSSLAVNNSKNVIDRQRAHSACPLQRWMCAHVPPTIIRPRFANIEFSNPRECGAGLFQNNAILRDMSGRRAESLRPREGRTAQAILLTQCASLGFTYQRQASHSRERNGRASPGIGKN
jgi:hypothetical protein